MGVHKLLVTTLESQVAIKPPVFPQESLALLQIISWYESRGIPRYSEGNRYIALLGPGKDPAHFKIPLFIDNFTWIRDAISECCQKHAECLSTQSLFVPGLLFIDCLADSTTISLVSAPKSTHYVALSYVWGGVHTTSTEVPAVIKDAIKVTVKLGLRFLWADRYCIPQNDSDKHRLIRSMDEIYSKAHVTIIAAAGKTAADGLPGINTIPRIVQMETKVSGCTFLELPSILDSIRASTWAQRGWTYQEGLLSTRCLVFTDRGVLYHCRGRYCEESVQQLTPPNAAAFMRDYHLLQTLFAPTLREYTQLQDRIVEYTRRNLSYPQDSLDAFLGVFAEYERQKTTPISPCSEAPSTMSSASRIASLPSHIWGLPLVTGITMLDWQHLNCPKRRRIDFPSWSWSGWEGGIKFRDEFDSSAYSSTDSKYAPILLEFPDNLIDPCDQKTRRLYVTGPMVTLKFATQKQTQSIVDGDKQSRGTGKFLNLDVQTSDHHVVFEVSPGLFAVTHSKLYMEPEVDDQIFGLLVAEKDKKYYFDSEDSFSIRSVIVLRKSDQSFTRIGCLGIEALLRPIFVNVEGAIIAEEMLPSKFNYEFYLAQKCTRQRICLE
ncbi:putative tol protein [Botrytis cinerea BcDW1]|nr:putative tol protein [Botrytis cinerea BcDW1]